MATKKKILVRKKVAKKKAPPRKKPAHPLMLDGKDWDSKKTMDFILGQIITTSFSLGTILNKGYQGKALPHYSTIMDWLDSEEGLSERYARAKVDQAEFMADEMTDIADDGRNDYMGLHGQPSESGGKFNKEHVQRSRLRIDTRKWLLAKLKPKKYGEKVDLNHGLQPDNPITELLGQLSGNALPVREEGEEE